MNQKQTKEEVIQALRTLRDELGHEPTAQEIDDCRYIIGSRQIQRLYGGLQNLRQELGFKQLNQTKGKIRSLMANGAMQRAKAYEKELVNALFKKWHDPENFTIDVHREFAYQQYIEDGDWYMNISCDVAISHRLKRHVVLIDFFYPQDFHSFTGCVRSKARKLKKHPVSLAPGVTHEVYFVCVNEDINQWKIDKSNVDAGEAKVLSLESFKAQFLS